MAKPESAASQPGKVDDRHSHDKLFRTVFALFLKDLIELVHPELAALVDLDHPRFVGEKLFADFRHAGHVRPDLVAEAATREDEPRLVLVHVEAEGEFRSTIDARTERYGFHLILKSGRTVLTIVVFLTGGPRGVEIREVQRKIGAFETSRFRYLAFGLSRSLAEDYLDRPQPLAAALAALMKSEKWDRVEHKLECLRAISRAKDLGIRKRYVLAKVVNTYLQLTEDEEHRFAEVVRREGGKEVQDMVVTWDEALAEREAIGEAKGRLEAAQKAVLVSARRRFGSLAPEFEEQIRAIEDLDRLYAVLEQILEADAIGDVLLGSRAHS